MLYNINVVHCGHMLKYTHILTSIPDIHDKVRNLFWMVIQLEEELLDMLITDWHLVTLLLQKGRYQLSLVVFFQHEFSSLSVARYDYLQKDKVYPLRMIAKLRTEKSQNQLRVPLTPLSSNSVLFSLPKSFNNLNSVTRFLLRLILISYSLLSSLSSVIIFDSQ